MDNSTLNDAKQQHAPVSADSAYDVFKSSPSLQQLNLGPVVNALMQNARERVNMASIRTLFACIGVGEAEPFNLPPQSQIVARLKMNANFFFTNYLLATAVVFFFLLCVVSCVCIACV